MQGVDGIVAVVQLYDFWNCLVEHEAVAHSFSGVWFVDCVFSACGERDRTSATSVGD